jgi:hypothetical protein
MKTIISFIKATAIVAVFALAVAGAYTLGRDKTFNEQALEAANTAAAALQQEVDRARDTLDTARAEIASIAAAME